MLNKFSFHYNIVSVFGCYFVHSLWVYGPVTFNEFTFFESIKHDKVIETLQHIGKYIRMIANLYWNVKAIVRIDIIDRGVIANYLERHIKPVFPQGVHVAEGALYRVGEPKATIASILVATRV